MPRRRRQHSRHKAWGDDEATVSIRVGTRTRSGDRQYHYLLCTGPQDAQRFRDYVRDELRNNPGDPLIIAVAGHQPWLDEIFMSCLQQHWSDISELNREVQFASTMQFPETASRLERGGLPYTFIVNEMNVPQVYPWSVGAQPSDDEQDGWPKTERYTFRVGVWFCASGACWESPQTQVYIMFTRQGDIDEQVVSKILIPYLYDDEDFGRADTEQEGLAWIFSRIWDCITDWPNVLQVVKLKLDEAEINSHNGNLSVKLRTRSLHGEVSRCYELKEYLQFQLRAFKKVMKLRDDAPEKDQADAVWGDIEDATDDLEQFGNSMDGLKERFLNLIELEFNIQNADQADSSRYLSIVATIFLPISYLASLFGMTTVTWPVIWYLWAAIPLVTVSLAVIILFPWLVKKWQKLRYPVDKWRLDMNPRDYTMLGQELPGSVNVAGGDRVTKARKAIHRRNSQPQPQPQPQRNSQAQSQRNGVPPRSVSRGVRAVHSDSS